MQNKPNIRFALAIFAAVMAVVYLGLGIFLLTNDIAIGGTTDGTLRNIIGIVLVAMGILRGLKAFQQIKAKRQHEN